MTGKETSTATKSMRLALLLAAVTMCCLSLAAKGPKGMEVSKYPRVALLVCRMANPSGLLSAITTETDYSLQMPDGKHDVCGDDEARLKKAFPAFPTKTDSHMPKIQNEFYGNLTQPITLTVTAFLKEKGRSVVDVRSLAGSWPKPLDQMTVGGILTALSGQADVLLVAHYMDTGNSIYDSVKVRRVDHGFSSFWCKFALFEIAGAKHVGDADAFINPMALLANDPALANGPVWKSKMKVLEKAGKDTEFGRGFSITERQGLVWSTSTVTTFDATDAEMINLAMHYFVEGFHVPKSIMDIDGLKDLLR